MLTARDVIGDLDVTVVAGADKLGAPVRRAVTEQAFTRLVNEQYSSHPPATTQRREVQP